MRNYELQKTDAAELEEFKRRYLAEISCPVDGMWAVFVSLADHYSIISAGEVLGYCAINREHKLLRFYLPGNHDAGRVFDQMVAELHPTGAVVNTGESQYLSLCMDHQKSVAVNALMYHVGEPAKVSAADFPADCQFRLVVAGELDIAVDFAANTLGADRDWLNGYFGGLVDRGELHGLWQDHILLATGELRLSDGQEAFADLGTVVGTEHRKQGLATSILRQLLHLCNERGLSAICSTESGNIGAQKAIERAGFVSHHRILEIAF